MTKLFLLQFNFIKDYLSWTWDPKSNTQPWKSANGRRIAYFSSMCRDKSLAEDDRIIKSSKSAVPWIQKLQDAFIISRQSVALKRRH